MMALSYIVGAVVLLGLCIFVHELGHLLGGKMVGIKARVFSMGYGPGFFKKKIGDTTYQVTLIPFGGYCQFYGDDPTQERTGEGYEFLSAHPLKRIVTVAMGPIFNLVFGILLFFMMNMIGYDRESSLVMIPSEYISAEYTSPAYAAGIRTGDRIVAIDGSEVKCFTDIQTAVFFSEGRELLVTTEREGLRKNFKVIPSEDKFESRFTIGVMPYSEGIGVNRVVRGSVAEKAGLDDKDIIYTVNSLKVHSPGDLNRVIREGAGEIVLGYSRQGTEMKTTVRPQLKDVYTITSPDLKKRDVIPGNEEFEKLIAAGNVRIDGKLLVSNAEFKKEIEKAAGRIVALDIEGKRLNGKVTVERRPMMGVELAFPGKFDMAFVQYGAAESFTRSFSEAWEFLAMNIKGFGMLFRGKLDLQENLSGPIRMVMIAGDVLYYRGVSDFILLMAKISIILMFMNLLPIPAVDGSHIIFYLIEAVRGKPINDAVMARIMTFGILFLIILGVLVIINDISMIPAVQNLFR